MTLTPITEAELLGTNVYYTGRWGYISTAMEYAERRSPETLLEVGPGYVPLFAGCDTMDIWGEPTYLHDATEIPWPVADKTYDVVLALQVWEHLHGEQARVFAEMERVARSAVLSFPLMWDSCPPDDDHYQISDEQIAEWTRQREPANGALVRNGESRLVLAFDFEGEA